MFSLMFKWMLSFFLIFSASAPAFAFEVMTESPKTNLKGLKGAPSIKRVKLEKTEKTAKLEKLKLVKKGSLNPTEDNEEDTVMVVEREQERKLIIMLGASEPSKERKFECDTCLYGVQDSNRMGDPLRGGGISINEKNQLVLTFSGGVRLNWSISYKFRYEPQQQDFVLVGADSYNQWFNSEPGEPATTTSVDHVTGEFMITATHKNDEEAEDEKKVAVSASAEVEVKQVQVLQPTVIHGKLKNLELISLKKFNVYDYKFPSG
jgi:hypothetical protein